MEFVFFAFVQAICAYGFYKLMGPAGLAGSLFGSIVGSIIYLIMV